jgi:hypothetical protein
MTTQALENLARARAAHTDAGVSLQAAADANSALLVRLSEAKAREAEAVRLAKADNDPTGKQAMALRLALDDQADIQKLIAGSQALVNTRNTDLSHATNAVQSAELAARREEADIQVGELDAMIAELEGKLIEAIRARLVVQNTLNPTRFGQNSTFKIYTPNPTLKGIVVNSVLS